MCLVCNRIEMIKSNTNPWFVKELETGYVVIGDNQYFKGYSLFLCKQHVTELYELEEEFRKNYLYEMSVVAEAVSKAFGAEKMNYELLGNSDTHVHWHLFPRKAGDMGNHGMNGRGPVWWCPREEMYAESTKPVQEEIDRMKEKLLVELEKLL